MYRQVINSLKMVFLAPVRLHWVQFAALGVSAASALMGYSGSKDAEKAAKEAAEREAAFQKEQARMQRENITVAQEEARHKAKNDIHDTTVAFMRQRASIVAGAGEAGVAGGSVIRSVVDRTRSQQDVSGRALYALEVFNAQAERDKRSADLGLAVAGRDYEGTSSTSLAVASGLNFASQALSIGTNSDGKWVGYSW